MTKYFLLLFAAVTILLAGCPLSHEAGSGVSDMAGRVDVGPRRDAGRPDVGPPHDAGRPDVGGAEDAGCLGAGCPMRCSDSADCAPLGECDLVSCRNGRCLHQDDQRRCPGDGACVSGRCLSECMCEVDGDCPQPPPFGCGRANCSECVCSVAADPSLCADSDVCTDDFQCVPEPELARVSIRLRTSYVQGLHFEVVRTVIDARPPIDFVSSTVDFLGGAVVAMVELEVGVPHRITVSLLLLSGEIAERTTEVIIDAETLSITLIIAEHAE